MYETTYGNNMLILGNQITEDTDFVPWKGVVNNSLYQMWSVQQNNWITQSHCHYL